MPAYKDKERGTWYAAFTYKNWKGETKNTRKRGFRTKKDALKYESDYKQRVAGTMDMEFKDFYEVYKEEHYPRIRESTVVMKDSIFKDKILPYFGEKKVRDITANDVIKWQNELIAYRDPGTGEPYKKSYLKTVHNQLSAILNYATRFYQLKDNAAKIAGNIGSEREIKMDFWTLDEYKRFAESIMDKPAYYHAFETLYWTGMREGELLALTRADVDLNKKVIYINKTFQIIHGEEVVGPTKTHKGNRVVTIPDHLCEELADYVDMLFDLKDDDRLFDMNKHNLYREMNRGCKVSGVKRIRIHDIRHSHVSLLINLGYSPVVIAERVGHESIYITYRYAHMFPEVQNSLADSLNTLMEED